LPVYTIQTPEGKKLKIEAADEATAIQGAQDWSRQNAAKAKPAKKSLYAPGETRFLPPAGLMANFNRGLGIGDEIAAGIGTAADLVTGKVAPGKPLTPGDVSFAFQERMRGQRQSEDQFAKDRPLTASFARGTGTAVTAAVPAGQTANAFAQAPRMVNALRGATVAGTQGAAFGLVDRGTVSERVKAGSRAAVDPATLALGAAGGALGPALRKAPKRVDEKVALLASEGVQLTPGQMLGGWAKSFEDAATSIPILGDAIQGARQRGLEGFNRAVVNRALKPLGTKLPDDVATGTDAIVYAGDMLSEGYKKVLPKGGVRADPGFAEAVSAKVVPVIETLRPEGRDQLQNIIKSRVTSRLDAGGKMTGETYKRVQSELGAEIARFSGSLDPDARAIGESLQGVSDALKDAAARQNPTFASRLKQLDEGWAQLTRVENAAKSGGDNGVFGAGQYDAAVRSGDKRVRRRGYVRDEALGRDISKAAKAVLPNKIPDSGTARRVMTGVGGIGVGGGAFAAGGPVGLATTGAALAGGAAAYSPRAVSAYNRALNKRIGSQAAREALVELKNMAARDPSIAPLYRQAAARLSRAAGASGGGRAGDAQAQSRNALASGNF
jgi:hypothetical protein